LSRPIFSKIFPKTEHRTAFQKRRFTAFFILLNNSISQPCLTENNHQVQELICENKLYKVSEQICENKNSFAVAEKEKSTLKRILKTQTRNFFSQNKMPRNIVINSSPANAPKKICIFLHGLGDTGEGWSMAFKAMANSKVKYIFPTAPTMGVTLNGGFVMNSWFDLITLSPNGKEDDEGINSASVKINKLIKDELDQYPNLTEKDIILGGFSQGGGLALYTGLNNNEKPFGGVIALSSWLPLRQHFQKNEGALLKALKDTRVFQGHGAADQVVDFGYGSLTNKIIKETKLESTFKCYNSMGHSSCDEEMADVKEFIESFVL